MADLEIEDATRISGNALISMPVQKTGSATAFKLVYNLEATTDPTINDDSGDGYSIGSLWQNVSTETMFRCIDASSGAAVWLRIGIDSMPPVMFGMGDGSGPVYASNPFQTNLTGAAQSADLLEMYPIYLPRKRTITKIAIYLNSSVAGNARLGLYNMLPDGQPGTLIVDGGTVSTAAAAQVAEVTVSQVVHAGWVWGSCTFNAAANVYRANSFMHAIGVELIAGGNSSASSFNGLYRNRTYAAFGSDESGNTFKRNPISTAMYIR